MNPRDPNQDTLADGPEQAETRATKTHVVDLSAMFPGHVFLHGNPARKEVALTFDDGPDNRFTPLILNLLSWLKVKGTFFLMGRRVDANPAVMKRIQKEGHAYGNHTYNHANLTKLDPAGIRREVEACEQAIARVTGRNTRLFRPPYGALTPAEVEELIRMEYTIVYWNVDSLDWESLTGPQVTANILANAGPGDIILQHSAGGRGEDLTGSANALPYVVETLQKEGYRFVTVPELLEIQAWAPPVRAE